MWAGVAIAVREASEGVQRSPEFLGRAYDAASLTALPPLVDRCGERGEFHTFCYGGPIFAEILAVRALMEQTWYNRGEFRSGILAQRPKSEHEITAKSFSIRPIRHPNSGWRTIKACSALFEAIDTRRTPKMPFTHAQLEFLATWANEEGVTARPLRRQGEESLTGDEFALRV
jgi:hypothetical protein